MAINYKFYKRISLSVAICAITSVNAIEFDYSLYSSIRFSDNLAQNNLQLSGQAYEAGGTFSFENEGQGAWDIEMSGALSKEWFSIDELADQDRNQLSASIEYSSPSSNFEFLLRDDYSQAPIDRFAVEEVGNIIDVNILTARPSYFLNITPLDLINAQITYLESTREGADNNTPGQESFDFTNLSKEIRYEKTINTSSDVSLVFDSTSTTFEHDSTGTDFEQENLFLRWVGRGRLNQIQLEAGKSRVKNSSDEDFDTELFNVLYSRQLNPDHSIGLSYRNSVNLVVRESFIDGSIDVEDQVGNFGNAQKVKSSNITYAVTSESISGDVQLFNATFAGIDGGNSEKRLGAGVTLNYSLSQYFSTAPQTNMSFSYQRNKNTFENDDGADIENNVEVFSLQFNYFAQSSLSYYLQFLKRNSNSTSLTTAFLSGNSNSITLGFAYAPTGDR